MNIQFRIEKLKSVFSVMLYVRISCTILHSVMTKDTVQYMIKVEYSGTHEVHEGV